MAQGSRVNRAALTLPGHASKASWTRGCKSFEDKNNMVTHTHVCTTWASCATYCIW